MLSLQIKLLAYMKFWEIVVTISSGDCLSLYWQVFLLFILLSVVVTVHLGFKPRIVLNTNIVCLSLDH
jgi:hypothetical protein